MHVYVTGASGFIGGAIARDLARDHTVHAMGRSMTSDEAIAALGAQPVRGDLMCCDCLLDVSKARHELGYDPVMNVDRGLAELKACKMRLEARSARSDLPAGEATPES